jgi:hypothetical protein
MGMACKDRGAISRMRVALSNTVECCDIGFCNILGRNESSNRKGFSLLTILYSMFCYGGLGLLGVFENPRERQGMRG